MVGSRAAMAWAGVAWYLPPKGMRTDPAPMEPSNRSTSPRRLAHFRLDAISRRLEKPFLTTESFRSGTDTRACFIAPLVFKNSRERSAIV